MNKYLGLPYKNKGRSWCGVDCYGLVYLFYKHEKNIILDKYDEDYQNSASAKEAHTALNKNKNFWAQTFTPGFGDVILFGQNGRLNHVGLFVDNKSFLHIQENTNSCIEKIELHKQKIKGYYRYDKNV